MERRSFELRLEAPAQEGRTIRGHAALFDVEADIGGMFRERIQRGAFKGAQKEDVRALWNHDASRPLGRTTAGTLRLSEDDKGLAVEIDMPNTTYANDLMESIRRGDVSQMSFGFQVLAEKWDHKENVRTLVKVRLLDVSPVTFPAYEGTDVAVRSQVADRTRCESAASGSRKKRMAVQVRRLRGKGLTCPQRPSTSRPGAPR
jgi:hypothetical protein